jgi:hypothetical protein
MIGHYSQPGAARRSRDEAGKVRLDEDRGSGLYTDPCRASVILSLSEESLMGEILHFVKNDE